MDNSVNAASNTVSATPGGGSIIWGLVLLLIIAGMYFLPTIIAAMRHKSNTVAIGALNFIFGWTVLGWVVCFIWSLLTPQQPQTIIVRQESSPASQPPPT